MSKTPEDKAFEKRVIRNGGFIIVTVDEPCYTCGHKKEMVYPQKTDGRVDIIRKCLYCLVKNPTDSNKVGA
jgi:hypothetical protein